jgi:hypothetical protein
MRIRLEELVGQLETLLPELEAERLSSAFANDVFEAVDYWRGLGRHVLDGNTKVNYPERAKAELSLWGKLNGILGQKPVEVQIKYAPLLIVTQELLQTVEGINPPGDGHLGFWRTIGMHFSFLQRQYAFAVTEKQPTVIRFSSGAVYLKLECIDNPALSCSFGPEPEQDKTFWIDDLLFLNFDQRYKTLPVTLQLDSEGAVDAWFKFLADIFKRYGDPVFKNKPLIFAQLLKAQGERDREYVLKMRQERSHERD